MGSRLGHGLLFSFEGIDGVGKSTQAEKVYRWLSEMGYPAVLLREPGGTPLGEALREVVLHRVDAQSPWAEFFLFAAARAELTETVIRPGLEQGRIVLMDRFIDSSVAYQGYGRGLDPQAITQVNTWSTGLLVPDLTFWLKGAPFRTGIGDRIENRHPSFFERVAEGYEQLARRNAGRWVTINANADSESVFSQIQGRVRSLIEQQEAGEL